MAYELPDQPCYHLRGERGVTSKIKQAMQETAKQFVYIGFLLWEVKQYEYFYEEGYSSVYEYAEAELGFKRSSTKNFIAICENFGKKETPMILDDRWSDYQYSQLTEMLSMSPKQRQETKPSMTVKQLRQIKKPVVVEQIEIKEVTGSGQTSGQKEPTLEEIEKENKRLNEVYGIEGNIVKINGQETEITHYVIKELCKLAGIRYIDYEDYEITIKMTEDESILAEGEKFITNLY